MPIREALAFIKAHGGGLSHEILVDQMRKKGYSEDEIEEALYIAKSEGMLGGKTA